MERTTFKDYLAANVDVDDREISVLLENCKVKTVKKNTYLLQPGQHSSVTYFVEKGLLRQYSLDEKGREHLLMFAPENWFVGDRDSLYCGQPSVYYIQALEDARVAMLDTDFMQSLSAYIPDFETFNNRLLHNHIRHLQQRINLLLSASAEYRYLKFIAMYPDILLRVPQTMVASYLGITPESLSRVRKELARKNFKTQ